MNTLRYTDICFLYYSGRVNITITNISQGKVGTIFLRYSVTMLLTWGCSPWFSAIVRGYFCVWFLYYSVMVNLTIINQENIDTIFSFFDRFPFSDNLSWDTVTHQKYHEPPKTPWVTPVIYNYTVNNIKQTVMIYSDIFIQL